MGEVAEMILEGTLCQYCGIVNPDAFEETYEPPGITWTCEDCEEAE